MQIQRSTLYSRIKKYRAEINNKSLKTVNLKNFCILENKVKRLKDVIEILKTVNCAASAPLKERLNALEKFYGKYSVHMICKALNVLRGTFYNHILRNKRDNLLHIKRRKIVSEKIHEMILVKNDQPPVK